MTDRSAGPLRLTLDTAAQLSIVRADIRGWLADAVAPDAINDILLATGEALANAVEHGRPPVDVGMQWVGAALAISVKDAGEWAIAPVHPNRGRGIAIMTALMDDVTFDTRDGTTVSITQTFRP